MGCNSSQNIPSEPNTVQKPARKTEHPNSGETVRSKKKKVAPEEVTLDLNDVELSSDCIIELESGKDEVQISATDDEYPEPEPSTVWGSDGVKPVTQWYSNWMPVYAVDSDEDRSRPGTEVSVFSRKSKKAIINFTAIDKRAREAPVAVGRTFDELISHLTEDLEDDPNADVLIVRAIMVWMSTHNADGMAKMAADTASPIGYLKLLQQGRATHSSLFTVLCRHANIVCVQVDGYAKCAGYQPGDSDIDSLMCKWNAVHVGGAWRIVHPFWICRALVGHRSGGWIKLETDGKSVGRKLMAASGALKAAFKEYYFLTNPNEFIYRCFPIDEKWQILPKPISLQRFISLPYLLPPFFGMKMKLKSQNFCHLKSENGKCVVEIQAPELVANEIDASYDLFFREGSADEGEESKMLERKNIPRLVLSSRNGEKFSFEVRFPTEGTYKLVIYGGPHNLPMLRLLESRIDCDKRLENCRLLPFDPKKIGWGPGPTAQSAGLFIPSHRNGVLSVIPKHELRLKFNLDRKFIKKQDVQVHLLDNEVEDSRENLKNNVKYKIDKSTKELNIYASVPKDGEYAMIIDTGQIIDNTEEEDQAIEYRNVCNYFLSTKIEKKYFNPPQRMAKCKLEKAVFGNSMEDLDAAVRKCEKVKVPADDDELASAKKRLEYLKLKNDLLETLMRRNMSVTKKTLKRAQNSIFRRALNDEMRKAEMLEEKLELLGGFTQEVPALEPAMGQIYPLVHPPDEVHNTLFALFIVLGESETDLDDWGYIQILLKERSDPHRGALHKMRAIPDQAVDDHVIHLARVTRAILARYTEEQVKKAHLAAARLYRWTDGVILAQMNAGLASRCEYQSDA